MIRVNGDPMDWFEGMTVSDMLEGKNYKFPMLIITVDEAMVEKPRWNDTLVPDGADVRVIHMLSGG